MLDPRIYRAALIPALLAFILLAFSLEDRPRPVGTTLAPIAFDGDRAWQDLQGRGGLAARYPDRRPGSPDDESLATHVSDSLRGLGFDVRSETRSQITPDGKRDLRTVIAERTGSLDGRLLVVAPRDAAAPGSVAALSATEGLLELARVFGAPRRTQRTLTIVSTSGSAGTTSTRDITERARRPARRGGDRARRPGVAIDAASVRRRLVRRPRDGPAAAATNRAGVAARGARRRSRRSARSSSNGCGSPRPAR